MFTKNSIVEMSQPRLIKSVFELKRKNAALGETVAIAISLKNNGEFVEDGSRASFLQRIQTIDANEDSPFIMDIEFSAVFYLNPPALPLSWTHYVQEVFPRLLFPHMRDYVAEISGLAGFSPLNINQGIFDDKENVLQGANLKTNKWVH